MSALQVLSLGCGVQSTTVFLMSCIGVLPKLDAAVFSDTQWEPHETYAVLGQLKQIGSQCGIPVHTVTAGSLRVHTVTSQVRGHAENRERYASMPLYTMGEDGSVGQIRRQCTSEYKIQPIEKFIRRELLKLEPGQKAPEHAVDQWFGISWDEWQRMRTSTRHWVRNIYPLIGDPEKMLPKRYKRQDCVSWMAEYFPQVKVAKSACKGCPYHDLAGWRKIKETPADWADVCEVDDAIRNMGGIRGQVFLHRSCKPLKEIDFSTDIEQGQNVFVFVNECEGMCGI